MLSESALPELHAALVEIARKAGEVALNFYRPGNRTRARVEWKTGGSPVTEADHAVDAFLGLSLPGACPLPVHTEERVESWRGNSDAAFVVDPIDGTRDFMAGGDAWCIVVGVVDQGRPICGVVHHPSRDQTFSAYRNGGAWLDGARIECRNWIDGPIRVAGSRSITESMAHNLGMDLRIACSIPSLASRVLAPLTGRADLALARAGGHDWDIAASDCILREAGAGLMTIDGSPPVYALTGGEHPPLMAGSSTILDKIRQALLTEQA